MIKADVATSNFRDAAVLSNCELGVIRKAVGVRLGC